MRKYLFLLFFSMLSVNIYAASSPNSKEAVLKSKVYKSPTCGCCGKWIDHMKQAGFEFEVIETQNLSPIKSANGIKNKYESCHTAMIGGYVFEGHIPASIVKRFLKESPKDSIGLAVPAMPIGSPGMEVGDRHDPYDVLLLKHDGTATVYEHIGLPITEKK